MKEIDEKVEHEKRERGEKHVVDSGSTNASAGLTRQKKRESTQEGRENTQMD